MAILLETPVVAKLELIDFVRPGEFIRVNDMLKRAHQFWALGNLKPDLLVQHFSATDYQQCIIVDPSSFSGNVDHGNVTIFLQDGLEWTPHKYHVAFGFYGCCFKMVYYWINRDRLRTRARFYS